MLDIHEESEKTASADEDCSWSFAPGDEIVPGVHAWALLGDGRRCETWLAWCVWRWAPVAIKLPRPDCINERTYQALSREANAVAPLAHPAIQRLLDARCEGPVPCLVFEYVAGPTLDQWLDEKGRLAPADVVRLGMQLASALHYIHGRGVVHCDLKPANLVLRDGRAVLLDWSSPPVPVNSVRQQTRHFGESAIQVLPLASARRGRRAGASSASSESVVVQTH